jgi:hypothetical protein
MDFPPINNNNSVPGVGEGFPAGGGGHTQPLPAMG